MAQKKFCNDGCRECYHEDRRQGLIYGSMAVLKSDLPAGMQSRPITGNTDYVLVSWEDGCRIEGSCCYCRSSLHRFSQTGRIKILVQSHGCGYTAEPVSAKWRKTFGDYMHQWGDYTDKEACQVYFPDYELPEEILSHRYFRELDRGWDLYLLVDPWTFGHWLGWDAQTVAEGRK